MTYPPQGGGQWQPNDPNQYPQGQPSQPFPAQQGQPSQPFPAQQGYPQQQGYPAQGYPQQPPYPPQQQPVYDQYGQPMPYGPGFPPPKRKRTGLIVGAIAAVAVVAGGVVTYVALDQTSVNEGSANPQEAAMKLVTSVGNADVAGLLTSLPPAESALLRDLNTQATDEFKRLGVYKKDADPDKVSGLDIKTENLKFDDAQRQEVNDHLAINLLVDGKITLNSDMSQLPLSQEFLDMAVSKGTGTRTGPKTQTIDIGAQVRKSHKPIRIATVKVDNEWYPSLFYTVADYALQDGKKQWPRESVPAKGAASPGDAVRAMADAALDANLERVIELLPPDEWGALHDAGPVLLQAIGGKAKPSGAKIDQLETDTNDVTGGTKVTLKSLTITVDRDTVKITKSGDCYEATVEGESHKLCASDATKELGGSKLPAGAKQAVTHLADGLFRNGLGVVTTKVDGKWYVSPGRSVFELLLTALRSLQPDDIQAIFRGRR